MDSTSHNKQQVNVAVVGVGYWGKNLVRNFHELGALTLLCDDRDSAEASCKQQYENVRFCREFSDVLADPSIDAVALATPAVTHYEMAKAALEAGKDVLVEKPLAIDVKHGEDLVRLATAKSRILMVGHILRYHPAILKLQELIQERRARKDQLPVFQPSEHRKDPDRGEHPVELRAARHLGDAVAPE